MKHQRILYAIFLLIVLPLLALRVRNWLMGDAGILTPHPSPDLLAYLEPAQAVARGLNPYILAVEGKFSNIPGNSPFFLLVMLPLALIDLPMANLIWWLINLGSAVAIIFILEMKFFPNPFNLRRFLLVTTLFLALSSTSSVIQLGQTTLVILLATLVGFLLLPKKPILAGLLFGIALSKYSLVFLIVPYLFFEKQYRALLVAIATQVAGVLILAWLVFVNPMQLVIDYARMAFVFSDSVTEFNLHSRLLESGLSSKAGNIIDVVGILVTITIIARYLVSPKFRSDRTDKTILLPLLLIGSIPFIYHRLYDGIVFILLTVILAWDLENYSHSDSTARYSYPTIAVTTFVLAILLYPRQILNYLPGVRVIGYYPETLAALAAWLFLITRLFYSREKGQKLGEPIDNGAF